MNLNEQCPKSAAEAVINDPKTMHITSESYPAITESQILNILETGTEYSESLTDIIKNAESVSIALSHRAAPAVAGIVLDMCGKKLASIYVADETPLYPCGDMDAIIEKYAANVITIDKNDVEAFDFYGASSSKAPLLFHKSLADCGVVIVISSTGFDNIAGFTGGAGTAFSAFAAKKTEERALVKCFAGAEAGKLPECRAGITKNNPAADCCKETIITTSRKATWYGVETINDAEGYPTFIAAGDVLMSAVKTQNEYLERHAFNIPELFAGIYAETDAETLPELAEIIERLAAVLQKGGRMFIAAPKLISDGGEIYKEIFNISSLHDIYSHAESSGSREYMSAYLLKKLASEYHIAVCTMFDTQTLRQAGLNPAEETAAEFLKNCRKIGYIKDASRFAKQ